MLTNRSACVLLPPQLFAYRSQLLNARYWRVLYGRWGVFRASLYHACIEWTVELAEFS